MNSIRKITMLFWGSAVCFLLMSATVLFMPMAAQAEQRFVTVIIGSIFWLAMISGYFLLILANRERKWFITHKFDGDLTMGSRIGLFSFFTNPLAAFADVTMILSGLLLVIFGFTKWNTVYGMYVFLFLFIFSLHGHALLNGRVYKATKIQRIERE